MVCEKCGGGAGAEVGGSKAGVLNDGLPK